MDQGDYISGEILAKKLHVSRTAIWKQIKSLELVGYQFESKKHRGYRLLSRPDIPFQEEIIPYIDTVIIGSEYHFFPSVSSTNTVLKELVKKGTSEGTIVVSEEQRGGRGRKQRSWSSPKGGLWFSVAIFPDIPPQKAMHVTMIASIAVVKAVESVCRVKALIKWPNDVIINGKKVCGVLTELDAEMDRIHSSIIGIGLNVYNPIPSFLSDKASSLAESTGNQVSRVLLLRSILSNMEDLYVLIMKKDFLTIRRLWLELTSCIGQNVSVSDERKMVTGRIRGIDENGCLLLQSDEGIIHVVSGDIEYI